MQLGQDQIRHVAEFTRELADSPAIAVTPRTGPLQPPAADDDYVDCSVDGEVVRYPPAQAHSILRLEPPGSVVSVRIGAIATAEHGMAVDDAFFTDLSSIDNGAWLRRGVADARGTVVALLAADHVSDAAATLAELTGRPAHTIATEPEASARGARTTPGLPPDSIVCDIGGGTIDVVGAHRTVIAAGAGETITIAVSRVLGIPRALAERVKRTPALRVENPHVAHEEDGRRVFLDRPATSDAIGWLCTRGSAGLVPFSTRLAAEEWRSLRLAIKQETVAANIARCLRAFDQPPTALVLAGGGALDDELLRTVGRIPALDPGRGRPGQYRRGARPAVRGGLRPGPSLRSGSGRLALPGSRLAHLLVVLGEVALHAVDVVLRQVDSTARTLHDRTGRHHPAWHGFELAADDVGDQQFVSGEVVLLIAVVPDVRVAILLVRFVFGVGPLAHPFLGGVAVPAAVPISQW